MGNLLDMGKAGSLHEYLMLLHEKYGSIVGFWWGKKYVYPAPAVKWVMKTGEGRHKPITQWSHENHTLRIDSVQEHHYGEYVCFAENEFGNDTVVLAVGKSNVPVGYKPNIPISKSNIPAGTSIVPVAKFNIPAGTSNVPVCKSKLPLQF